MDPAGALGHGRDLHAGVRSIPLVTTIICATNQSVSITVSCIGAALPFSPQGRESVYRVPLSPAALASHLQGTAGEGRA